MRFFGLAVVGALGAACEPVNVQPTTTQPQSTSEIADIHTKLGIAYLQKGNLEIAWQRLHTALEHDPQYSTAHNAMALLYERLGQPDEAESHFRAAIQADPGDSWAQNNYGRFLCEGGRYDEAEARFLQAIKNTLYENREVAFSNAGQCARDAGAPDKAEAYLRSALDINPKIPTALLTMAELSFAQQHFMSARGYLQRYVEVGNHTARSLWLGIRIECELGDKNAVSSYAMRLRNGYPAADETRHLDQSCVQ